jgi:hypothetical protein
MAFHKFQIPSAKFQADSKFQIPNLKPIGFLRVGLGIDQLFAIVTLGG